MLDLPDQPIGRPLPRFLPDERPHAIGGRLVYAVGDIHGCYDELKALLDIVSRDAETRAAGRRPVLIFCGDYVDRGPDSARVLDALCWLGRHCPFEPHFLKGNHDQVFCDYMRDPTEAVDWLRFGGAETMQSYGVTPPAPDAPFEDHVRARDDMLAALPMSHWKFLEALKGIVTIGDYAFVHAGVRPRIPLDRQSEEDLLWIREGFLDYDGPQEKVIVHGHTWHRPYPDIRDNRIGIDTGAYETGVLTALRIEDGRIAIIQNC